MRRRAALGFALGMPVRGVSTLDALLVPAEVDVACIDARRGEVFCAGRGDRAAGDDARGDGRGARRLARSSRATAPCATATGSPALDVPPTTRRCTFRTPATTPRCIAVAGPPEPLYLRDPDADRTLAAKAPA